MLIELVDEAIQVGMDFTVICGHRSEEDQEEAFATGRSKVRYPRSRHNSMPSLAVDIAPWPIDWEDHAAFARLAGIMEATAYRLGISIRWGGDWNKNHRTRDERFIDMPHFELAPLAPETDVA